MNESKIHVNMSELCVAKSPTQLICLGLGSCIAIALYDGQCKIGGLAHVVLPYARGEGKVRHPGKFGNTAVKELLRQMKAKGANLLRIKAKIFGGANMFPQLNLGKKTIGQSNIEEVKKALKNHEIAIIAEEVGGQMGRTIVFETSTGQVCLKTKINRKENIF